MTWNLRRWWSEHSLKLLAIRDTPEAIAGGVAIGIFFAWLTRSNILATVLAATLHDVILPLMPMIYRWEYDLGYWILSVPHHWPPSLVRAHWEGYRWRDWTKIFTVGKPLLLGSILCAAPLALIAYFITRTLVARHHRRHPPSSTAKAAAE